MRRAGDQGQPSPSPVEAMRVDPKYLAAWRGWRRRALVSWIGAAVFLLSPLLGGALTSALHAEWPGWACGAAGLALLAAASAWARSFRCPRCGHPFFSRTDGRYSWVFRQVLTVSVRNAWAGRCLSCGLPKGALTSSGVPTLADLERVGGLEE